jgi:hypothetical protein
MEICSFSKLVKSVFDRFDLNIHRKLEYFKLSFQIFGLFRSSIYPEYF